MRSPSRSDRPPVVRLRSVRLRITTLMLVAFAALTPMWAYAMYLTVPAGLELSRVQQLHPRVGVPTDDLDSALSAERKATVVYLARPGSGKADLDSARADTDKALKEVKDGAMPAAAQIAQPLTRSLLVNLVDDVKPLAEQRAEVDQQSAEPAQEYAFYGTAIDGGLRVLNSMTRNGDSAIQSQGEALSRLTRSRSLLEELDARVTAATTVGTIDAMDLYDLTENIGEVNGSYATAVPNLPAATAKGYEQIAQGSNMTELRDLEQQIATTKPGAALPVTTEEWADTLSPLVGQLHQFELATAVSIGAATAPKAQVILIRAGVATGFGLIGVIALIIVGSRAGRRLIRETTLVRDQMEQVAQTELPELVRRLRAGEKVDTEELSGAAAPYRLRTKELAELNQSFDRVRRVAAESSAGEAKLRDGVSDVFVSLSRRNQALLHRQLKLLDKVERENTDPDQLEQLFALDHLATRMRRHAESLIILSGGAPGRGWSRPVPVVDLIRSAVTEVEEYTRVTVYPMPQVRIAGTAVADIIHLLAELIENSTLYSPPDSPVQVRGLNAANGFAIEVEDAGLGMGEGTMAEVNRQLAEPPEFTLTDTGRLGLFVVGQLARRHGIRVQMRVSPYGGTTAIVLLPLGVLAEQPAARNRAGVDRLDADRGAHRAEDRPVAGAEPPLAASMPGAEPPGPPLVPIQPTWTGVTGAALPNGGTRLTDGTLPSRAARRAGPAETPGGGWPGGPSRFPGEPPEAPYLSMTPPPPPAPEAAMVDMPPMPDNPLAVVPDADRPRLPKRARQASLAPGLRQRNRDASFAGADGAVAGRSGAEPAARSPEEARSLLASIQQGWAGIRPDSAPPSDLPASYPPDVYREYGEPPVTYQDFGDPPVTYQDFGDPPATYQDFGEPPAASDWPAVAGWPAPTARSEDSTGIIPRINEPGPDSRTDRSEAGE